MHLVAKYPGYIMDRGSFRHIQGVCGVRGGGGGGVQGSMLKIHQKYSKIKVCLISIFFFQCSNRLYS